MKIIGITGVIGAGKSVAAQLLAAQHVPVFDADKTLHTIWFDANTQTQLKTLLAKDGIVERADVRHWLNFDSQKLRNLEKTLYPLLWAELQNFLTIHKQTQAPYVVLDIPLLFEKDWHVVCTQTICMVAPIWLCRRRALKRPHTTIEFYNFMSAQHWPQQQKAQAANYVISSLWGRAYVAWRLSGVLSNH